MPPQIDDSQAKDDSHSKVISWSVKLGLVAHAVGVLVAWIYGTPHRSQLRFLARLLLMLMGCTVHDLG